MYKLAFAILLISAASPITFGEGRGLNDGAPLAVRFRGGREPVTAKPSGRKSRTTAEGQNATKGVAARTPGGKTQNAAGSSTRANVVFPSGESLTVVKGHSRAGQEHYDPTGSGNPLLDAGGANRLKKLSDNFSVDEMAQSGGKEFDIARIDPEQVICLQAIRDYIGRPVLIRSGYRSFWHNVEVYRRMGKKATKSQHISGKASDIWVKGMTGLEVAEAAVAACGPDIALGIGLEFAHVDVRGRAGVWVYEGVPRRQAAELERYRTAHQAALRRGANRRRRASFSKRT